MAKKAGFRINDASIYRKIARSNKYKQFSERIAQNKFNKSKKRLLEEYDAHPVTLELQSGKDGKNMSGTLGGYGNLFTFIGFPEGADPTALVKAFLISAIKMKRVPNRNNLNVNYTVSIPSLGDFNVAKMPWEQGNNWVNAVEEGVSGFNYFMSKASNVSRSGEGIQINNKLRSVGSSANIKYMSKILIDFKKRIIGR